MTEQEKQLQKNFAYLDEDTRTKIQNSSEIGTLTNSKTGVPNLVIDQIYFHSRHNPQIEAQRLVSKFSEDPEKRICIFFGAGLGYAILSALENPRLKIFWLEAFPGILKSALSINDFSDALCDGRLKILTKPIKEDELFANFKGLSNLSVSFIPHRESFTWNTQEYIDFKYICESFFKKKDVNIATLTRFEKIWTRNILQNLPELVHLSPISTIFEVAKNVPIIVAGAGPSLYQDLPNLKKFREEFVLISVDTALHVLYNFGIDPDLIYSVDPQALNSSYLEGYEGQGKLVFDPTSSYHTLRLSNTLLDGFFTSSPFPLIKILSENLSVEVGDVPFGGSVSTNAVSLAQLMKGNPIFLVGQDLAFTNGYAHCRGAILEERLNYKESRFFRREKHNHLQIHALTKKESSGYDEKKHITNDKMLIFKKWFEEASIGKNWINLTSDGTRLTKIPQKQFSDCFEIGKFKKDVQKVREQIRTVSGKGKNYIQLVNLTKNISLLIQNLEEFEKTLSKGQTLSQKIYNSIKLDKKNHIDIQIALKEMDDIDEIVSSKKNLNEIIGTAIQRVILMITEEYEIKLTLEEKKNPMLQVAKKSLLLYEGLHGACQLTKTQLKKILHRIENLQISTK